MKNGVGVFNKSASNLYKLIDDTEKKRLVDLSLSTISSNGQQMSSKEIHKAAAKIFKSIENKVII